MKNKEQLIEEFLKTPIKPGQSIEIQGLNPKSPQQWERFEVKAIKEDVIIYDRYRTGHTEDYIAMSAVRRVTDHIGANPFKAELRGNSYQVDIEALLWRTGWEWGKTTMGTKSSDLVRREEKNIIKGSGISVPEVCINPMVIDAAGDEVEFQRGLVWTLDQKKLLIESIYNQIEIGKVVLRKRSFDWVEKRVKAGKFEHTAFADLVDGKQRVNALVEFISGKFEDLHGNYFDDLSMSAKRKFMSYRQVTFLELDENSTDADTLKAFLAINFTGVPMSKEHIAYVQSIKL
jgi:hypothetical protein